MNPYIANMTQDATYWPIVSVDSFNKPVYGSPVPIKCRWQDKQELFRSVEGEQLVSQAVIYPDRPVLRKGYLYRGIIATSDPRTVEGAHQIIQIGDSPSLGGTRTLYKVFL